MIFREVAEMIGDGAMDLEFGVVFQLCAEGLNARHEFAIDQML